MVAWRKEMVAIVLCCAGNGSPKGENKEEDSTNDGSKKKGKEGGWCHIKMIDKTYTREGKNDNSLH